MSKRPALRRFIDFLLPHGYVEYRRRKARLSEMGLDDAQMSGPMGLRQLDRAMRTCRFDLLPTAIRETLSNTAVIDVGANKGQFTGALLEFVRPQELVLFEPQKKFREKLEQLVRKSPQGRVVTSALGDRCGTTQFHITNASQWGSILRPRREISDHYRNSPGVIKQTIEVPLSTLDIELSNVGEIGLLKVDVQGFELPVLRGASETLRRTKAVMLEINYTDHYEESTQFEDTFEVLRSAGFKLAAVSEPEMLGYPLWADAVFVNA